MKKLTIVLIIAAVAGGTAWIFGTKQGKEFLEGFKDNVDEGAAKLKTQLHKFSDATAGMIEKGKRHLKSNNSVKEPVS
jgi:hypothetical protein